ncbi:MAG: hypothetical protein MMC33_003386 [Icmadophila ericetorum]|nr:hypothetical protein [Icmadophila ericetorum]
MQQRLIFHFWDTEELPALHDGETIVSGYQEIVRYLSENEIGTHYDEVLTPIQKADALAFSSHIHTTLSPLLLLYLYLTPKNWNNGVRTALSTPLPFPIRYIIPPHLHTFARSRTAHLGFSALDLTAAAEEEERKAEKDIGLPEGNNISSSIRNALKSRRSAASAARRDIALQIKLHALVDTALEPLADALFRNENIFSFFLGLDGKMTSFDCLALGYLSLALIPKLPEDWLDKGILGRYPTLSSFVNEGVERCFGGVTDGAIENLLTNSILPWSHPATPPLFQTAAILLRSSFSSEPALSHFLPQPQISASRTSHARYIPSSSLIPTVFRSTALVGLSWIGGSILWPEWFRLDLRQMMFELAGAEARFTRGSLRGEGEKGVGEAERMLESLWG